jgi:hypothetical protein
MVVKWGHRPRRKGSCTRGEDWVRVARDMRLVEGDAQSWVVVVGQGRTEVGDDRRGPHVGGMEVAHSGRGAFTRRRRESSGTRALVCGPIGGEGGPTEERRQLGRAVVQEAEVV